MSGARRAVFMNRQRTILRGRVRTRSLACVARSWSHKSRNSGRLLFTNNRNREEAHCALTQPPCTLQKRAHRVAFVTRGQGRRARREGGDKLTQKLRTVKVFVIQSPEAACQPALLPNVLCGKK